MGVQISHPRKKMALRSHERAVSHISVLWRRSFIQNDYRPILGRGKGFSSKGHTGKVPFLDHW